MVNKKLVKLLMHSAAPEISTMHLSNPLVLHLKNLMKDGRKILKEFTGPTLN